MAEGLKVHSPFKLFSPPPIPDGIIALASRSANDHRPEKVDAGLGYLRRESSQIFLPQAVIEAQRRTKPFPNQGYIVPDEKTHWSGDQDFLKGVSRIVFGGYAEELLSRGLVAAVGTAGGTHAVVVGAEMIKRRGLGLSVPPRILLGTPAYPNHRYIFNNLGLTVDTYKHLTEAGKFDLEATLEALKKTDAGTAVVLQGVHNPTGMNTQNEQDWRKIAQAMYRAGSVAFFDFPYVGLGINIAEDMKMIPIFLQEGVPIMVGVSFSKTGGLYERRTGALLTVTGTRKEAIECADAFNEIVRFQISSPPVDGERWMGMVLTDPKLNHQWANEELPKMAEALAKRRERLANELPQAAGEVVSGGQGMFSLLPISTAGTAYLEQDEHIYAVPTPDGTRVNIGGVPLRQVKSLGKGLNKALKEYPFVKS